MFQDTSPSTDPEPGYYAGRTLEPDTVVPAQFHSRPRTDASMVPEKRLLLAVLEEALTTLRRTAGAKDATRRRLFYEAERWFASDDVGWPCSFVSICDALDIDPSRVRAGLVEWMRAERPARRRAAVAVVSFPMPPAVETSEDQRRSA